MILAVAGKKGAGKDTLADALVKRFKFKKISLADELKTMCSEVFKYPNTHNYDPTLKEKKWDTPITINASHIAAITDYLLANEFNVTEDMVIELFNIGEGRELETPRQLLQFVGTDMIRTVVDPDVWIKLTKRVIKDMEGHVVIPDARFENERNAFRNIGGKVALVKRPNIDIEYGADNHVSENQLGEEDEYDYIFNNSTTLPSFQEEVELWFSVKVRVV